MNINRRQKLWVYVTMCCSILLSNMIAGYAEETAQEKTRKINRKLELWQPVFGPVDFRPNGVNGRTGLFEVMLYAGIQPLVAMGKFEDKKLSPRLIDANTKWLKTFLKPTYNVEQIARPSHYLLSKVDEEVPDLLFYQLKDKEHDLDWFDNANMIMFLIKPSNFDAKNGVTPEQLSDLLWGTFNLYYESAHNVAVAFKLSKVMHVGDVFLNNKRNRVQPARVNDWHDNIIGFVGENGINIVCFKMQESRRARSGLPWEPYWLAGQLFEMDEVTLVKRPT